MKPGIPAALLSALLFGASAPFAKLLLGEISPWLLAGLLYAGSGCGLFLLRLTGLMPKEAGLSRADLPIFAIACTIGGVIAPVLLMLGLARLDGASATLLLNVEALFTLAIAWIVFKENVDLQVGLGAFAILIGAVILSWNGDGSGLGGLNLGALLVAGACLCWGIDNNLARKISGADPVQMAMLRGLAAGATNLILAVSLGASWPALPALGGALVVGFFGYGISLVAFILALRHLGTARTGAYFSTAPFLGAGLAFPLLGEHPDWRLVAAGALMALGLVLHLVEKHEHDHTHEEMDHEHAHRHDEHHQHEHPEGEPASDAPHVHRHTHHRLHHRHAHFPDTHHRHRHGDQAS